MAAFDTTTPLASTGSARWISSLFVSAFSGFSDWHKQRETRNSLLALSDRELDDIGLSRADVYRVSKIR